MAQSHHFVEDTAQAPDITLLIVRLLLTYFGRQVVRRSDSCLRAIVGVLKDSGNTEVSDLNLVCLGHEDVLGLQVSV